MCLSWKRYINKNLQISKYTRVKCIFILVLFWIYINWSKDLIIIRCSNYRQFYRRMVWWFDRKMIYFFLCCDIIYIRKLYCLFHAKFNMIFVYFILFSFELTWVENTHFNVPETVLTSDALWVRVILSIQK